MMFDMKASFFTLFVSLIIIFSDFITGELLSRGHNVMIGYWGEEQKTRESINEAKWYKSGYVRMYS